MEKEKRNRYRIHYPVTKNAVLRVLGISFDIVDLSETGAKVRFSHNFEKLLELGKCYKIFLTLLTGEILQLQAKALRIKKDALAFSFESSIPYELIMKEQRYLILYRLKTQGQNINQE